MREIERDVEILKALDDIPLEAGGVGHGLNAAQNFGPLQGEPPGHDEADVAAAQNEYPFAYQIALHVDIALGSTGGVDAGGAGARDGEGAAGPLPAAHGQNHAPGLFHAIAQRGAHHVDPPLLCEFQNRGVRPQLHPGFGEHPEKTPGILRTGELLLEIVKAEAAVDALVQDAARLPVPLHH